MRCLRPHKLQQTTASNTAEEDSGYTQGLGRGHGGMGTWGGQWEPPISFWHMNPGDYSLMGRIVDTRTHRLAPNGGTGAELTHPPTWVPYPGSLGCCAPLEDHGEAKFSELTSVFALPLSLHKQEDPLFLSVFPTPPSLRHPSLSTLASRW